MHRFIIFASRLEEIVSYRERYLDIDMMFVSYAQLEPNAVQIGQENYERAFVEIEKEHRRRSFTGVLNRREKYVLPASLLAARLGLRPIVRNPYLLRDKFKMRQALSLIDSGPRVFLIEQERDLNAVPDEVFPAILKPRFGFNGRAVTLVRNSNELAASFHHSRQYYIMLKREDTSNCDFVLEEYIEGTEHTVEALVYDGEIILNAISDKMPVRPPYFVEEGDIMPSQLSESQQRIVLRSARRAVECLGFRNGWMHIELKLANNEPTVIEAAARMGGGYFGQMIELVYGLDQMRLLMDIHLGAPSQAQPFPKITVVGRRIISFGISYVAAIWWKGSTNRAPEGMLLIWPNRLNDAVRVIIGPPFAYKNTIFEYFCANRDAAEALRSAERIKLNLRMVRITLPLAFDRAVWRLMRLWLQLRGRPFDG